MKISRLTISNFRGIVHSELFFENHTLFIGTNNVGKSTVCEAIDLVLGPDRLTRLPPLEEYDFYNGQYLQDDHCTPKPLRIEIVLTDLTGEVSNTYGGHLEFWDQLSKRLLGAGEVDKTDDSDVKHCLRLETIGKYNVEEDEFEAKTYFSHSPNETGESLKAVNKSLKRMIGFLYLRTLRTGSRALSLERGSLLDIILRLAEVRTGLWQTTIDRLKNLEPPIDHAMTKLRPVLEAIENRLSQYIAIDTERGATKLFVSQLTREHLRKTLSFFLSMSNDQEPVPFQEVGTGTLNTLVLALLSFIAELKEQNVIFAMEEPEIALPPHTQRRIANYLLNSSTQCFITSHSPYVIEIFEPEQIQILRRNAAAELSSQPVLIEGSIKHKHYRRQARRGLCEAMLGRAAIVVEGTTEQVILSAVARKMEEKHEHYPFDLSGVTIFCNDGDGSLPEFGLFFKNIGLKTFAFYDKKLRNDELKAKLASAFDIQLESIYKGAEKLLVEEIPIDHLWEFLDQFVGEERSRLGIPSYRPKDALIKDLTLSTLTGKKGDGSARKLIELCNYEELPTTVTAFLIDIYSQFQRPVIKPLVKKVEEETVSNNLFGNHAAL